MLKITLPKLFSGKPTHSSSVAPITSLDSATVTLLRQILDTAGGDHHALCAGIADAGYDKS
jgi:hypothetical protein